MSVSTIPDLPNHSGTPVPVAYFSLVRLRHHSGGYLASGTALYTHKGGSGQQSVGCVPEPDESTLWLLRPFDRGDFEKSGSDKVNEGDVIRLQHLKTGRNLHSHDRRSPHSGQQEVSCLGEDGACNHDDDWVIETRSGQGIAAKSILRLLHVTTGHYLHSHDDRHFQAGETRFQEVTGYSEDDSNNDWQIVDVLPAPSKYSLHPFFRLAIAKKEKAFDRLCDLKIWFASEKEVYEGLLNLFDSSAHELITDHVSNLFAELDLELKNASASDVPKSPAFVFEMCANTFTKYYGDGKIVPSRDSTFRFVRTISKSDAAAASHALAYFFGLDPEMTKPGMKGLFSAMAFENGLSGRAKEEAEELGTLKIDFEKAFENQRARQLQVEKTIESALSHSQNRLSVSEHAFKSFLERSDAEKTATLAAFRDFMATQASVSYWTDKATKHHQRVQWLARRAIFLGFSVVAILICLIIDIFGFYGQVGRDAPFWWQVGAGVVVATFGIWFVRVIVQLIYSNVHLSSDAEERVAMIQTYLAMLKDQEMPLKEDHKLLVLQSLFRPAATGAVKDDGSPTTLFDFFASKIGGKSM